MLTNFSFCFSPFYKAPPPQAIFQRLEGLWKYRTLPDTREISDSHQKSKKHTLTSLSYKKMFRQSWSALVFPSSANTRLLLSSSGSPHDPKWLLETQPLHHIPAPEGGRASSSQLSQLLLRKFACSPTKQFYLHLTGQTRLVWPFLAERGLISTAKYRVLLLKRKKRMDTGAGDQFLPQKWRNMVV